MCGIIGVIYNKGEAAKDAYIGLMSLQHRGKEAAGIVTGDNNEYCEAHGKGEVAQVFPNKESLKELKGNMAIGQTRYSTTGGSFDKSNLQPIRGYFRNRPFYVVHNGNLVNLNSENTECAQTGESDTCLFVQKLEQCRKSDFIDAIISVIRELKGSFCFIVMFEGQLIAIKDRFGFCPLVIGKKNGGYIIASETCALNKIDAEIVRDIRPGEMAIIIPERIESLQWTKHTRLKFSIFEFIYFLNPASIIFGVEVGTARRFIGQRLARRHGVPAQMVLPIPDSANDLAHGYYIETARIYPEILNEPHGLLRSHTVGRTFIEPIHTDKERAQRQKFITRWPLFKNIKELVILDDSLIRSTVITKRIADLKNLKVVAQAYLKRTAEEYDIKKIHVRIGSPPYAYGDYYGVDTYRKNETLIIRDLGGNIDKLVKHLDIASLAYADLYGDVIAGVLDAQSELGISNTFTSDSFYTGPFTGEYPDGIGVYAN